MQYVSSTPATRLDVINLQEQLDHRLLQRQARETGIDPVREELYGQCFGDPSPPSARASSTTSCEVDCGSSSELALSEALSSAR